MIYFYIFASFWLIAMVAGVIYMWDERKDTKKQPVTKAAPPDLARLRQLALLGLDDGATKDEIRSAYKRLSRIHHPDRCNGMSEADTEKAAATFRKIREAYEFLT